MLKQIVKKWSFTEFGPTFFKENRDTINKKNMETIKKMSVFISIIFVLFVLIGLFLDSARERIVEYIVFGVIFVAFYFVTKIYEKTNAIMGSRYAYAFASALFVFGILLGNCFSRELPSVMFLVLTVCVPMLFIVPPLYMSILEMIYIVVFLVTSYNLKSKEVFEVDLLNTLGCYCVYLGTIYTTVCNHAKDIVLNVRLKEECNDDELTGMRNRRDFNEYIRKVVNMGKEKEISVMLVDIDDFREYTNMYGQSYGDKCVIEVANVLERFAEKHGCYVARYTGEEFVIVDKKHNQKDLEAIAAELIESIEMLNIENINSKYQKVTISVGIASKELSNTNTTMDLLNLADDALYQAKLSGKNIYMTAKHNANIRLDAPIY